MCFCPQNFRPLSFQPRILEPKYRFNSFPINQAVRLKIVHLFTIFLNGVMRKKSGKKYTRNAKRYFLFSCLWLKEVWWVKLLWEYFNILAVNLALPSYSSSSDWNILGVEKSFNQNQSILTLSCSQFLNLHIITK